MMRYTVCKAPKMREWLHDWLAPPEWTVSLICEEQYLQEVVLPHPGIYAIDSNGRDVVPKWALKVLGIRLEEPI